MVEREAVLVGIDVGTSKVCALIGEVSRDGRLTIMGHGTVPASGLKKGVVINIDQTVRSIADAVERAERLSGWKIDRAFVGVGGQHVESLNSPGQVAVTAHHREVTREDVNRAIEVARAVSIPSNREVLHVERRGFTVDGQEGVKDPLGMSALRLEVETHIVTASATAVQNLSKCVAAAGVKIDELVADSLASAEAVLSETEKELGVAVADIGAGTIDLALFQDGSPFHTRVLPVGGNNVTNDVAIGLKTSLQVAEELKIRHGTADLRAVEEDDDEEISVVGPRRGRRSDRQPARGLPDHRGADARDLRAAGATRSAPRASGMLPAGIILTGGASQLAGVAELGRSVLQMPVRVAAPSGIGGLVDTLLNPSYSTAVGLLQWGAISLSSGEPLRYESAPAGGRPRSDPRRAPEHLPVRTTELTVRTGTARGWRTSPPHVRTSSPTRPTGCCRSSCRTPRPGLSSSRSARDRTTTSWRRSTGSCPTTSACTATATGRPATAPTTSCRSRLAVADGARDRRPPGARDVAVDLPPRPERRQPEPDRPALVPLGGPGMTRSAA